MKIRGFRIELGEIEARRLDAARGVRSAVVVARDAASGDAQLVGYVRGDGRRRPGIADAAALLAQRLPEYMVPARDRGAGRVCR